MTFKKVFTATRYISDDDNDFQGNEDPCCSIIRELHAYGSAVPVAARNPTNLQHQVRSSVI
ncbi:unnamed protein product [Schistosoma margrebowiei]|uniref:Uncharacterized protein n=1 Tax=Schistosoma margrebowiei TaxID=48269 RepID=A0A183N205_9TREM|nr:unnamed protein product [Schistosoma margrebowiei]